MTRIGRIALTFMVFFSVAAAAAEPGQKDAIGESPTDLERVKVGGKAPDFMLEDVDGRQMSLSDFRGKQHVVLVFYRGYW